MRFIYFVLAASLMLGMHVCETHVAAQTLTGERTEALSLAGQGQTTRRRASLSDTPTAPEGTQIQRWVTGLPDLGGMTVTERGDVYVIDMRSDRILHLADRNDDGRVDMRRPVGKGFDSLSDVTWRKPYLYAVDAQAVWRIDPRTGQQNIWANLAHIDALKSHRYLSVTEDSEDIYLSLSFEARGAAIFALNLNTAFAREISKGDGPITALSLSPAGSLWIGVDGKLLHVTDTEYSTLSPLEAGNITHIGAEILAIAFSHTHREDSFSELLPASQILISTGQSVDAHSRLDRGHKLLSLGLQFGRVSGPLNSVLDGFAERNGRRVWGRAGPIYRSEDVFFIMDAWAGTIWALRSQARAQEQKPAMLEPTAQTGLLRSAAVQDEASETSSDSVQNKVRKDPRERAGSLLPHGSTLDVGSHIADQWAEDELQRRANVRGVPIRRYGASEDEEATDRETQFDSSDTAADIEDE